MVGFYVYPFHGASEQLKVDTWAKGQPIPDYDAAIWRRDLCGRFMRYSDHGDRSVESGWEIDHILPSSLGGTDEIANLQPLNWSNNAAKGDQRLWSCP